MNFDRSSPIEREEKCRKNPSKFRLSILNWFTKKSIEEKIKVISITNKPLINVFLQMYNKHCSNSKSRFKFPKINENESNKHDMFIFKIETDAPLSSPEKQMLETEFFKSLRLISVYEENDTITLLPSFFTDRSFYEYAFLYFSKNHIFEEPCEYEPNIDNPNIYTFELPNWQKTGFLTLPSIFISYFEKYLNMNYFLSKNSKQAIIYDENYKKLTEFPNDFFIKKEKIIDFLDTIPKNDKIGNYLDLNKIIEKNYHNTEIFIKNKKIASRRLFYKAANGQHSFTLFEPCDDSEEKKKLYDYYVRLLGLERPLNIVDEFMFLKIDKVNTMEYYIEQEIIDKLLNLCSETAYSELMKEIDNEHPKENNKVKKKKNKKKKKIKKNLEELEEKKVEEDKNEQNEKQLTKNIIINLEKKEKNFNSDSNDSTTKLSSSESCEKNNNVIDNALDILQDKKISPKINKENKKISKEKFNKELESKLINDLSFVKCNCYLTYNYNNDFINDSSPTDLKFKDKKVDKDKNMNKVKDKNLDKIREKSKDINNMDDIRKDKNNINLNSKENPKENQKENQKDNQKENIKENQQENQKENQKDNQKENQKENQKDSQLSNQNITLTSDEIEEFEKEINKTKNSLNINIPQIKHPKTEKEILHNLIIKESNELIKNTYKLNSIHYTSLMFLFTKIKEFLNSQFSIEIYGSYSTGLQLESSDIDISIKLKNNNHNSIGILITELSIFLQKFPQFENLFPIVQTAVPILKFYINPNKIDQNYEENLNSNKITEKPKIQIDLTFNLPKIKDNILFINELLVQYKEIKPLFLLLKNLLKENKLNSTFDGGISSHCLFLMIGSYLKTIKGNQTEKTNLGQLLLDFLYFYGCFFKFSNTIIDITNQNSFQIQYNFFNVPQIIDPISKVNVAKSSFKYNLIVQKFSSLSQSLSDCKENNIEKIFYQLFSQEK